MYKPFLLICIFALTHISAFSQNEPDNYSFFKAFVTNDKKQILLVKWEGEWEIAGERYNQNFSISAFLDKMGSDMGIKLANKKLRGLFTFHYPNRPNPTLMHYYQATYASGTLRTPPDCSEIKWFSLKDALQVIPYPAMKMIAEAITGKPEAVFGGAFKPSSDQRQVEVLEKMYELN
jgi:hypothetical protein